MGYVRATDPDTVLPALPRATARSAPSWRSPSDARAGSLWSEGDRLLVVMRPRRLTGMSRRPPIGWRRRGPGERRPHVPSGLLEPRPLGRSTSHPASVRETPNGEAPGRAGPLTPRRVDGRDQTAVIASHFSASATPDCSIRLRTAKRLRERAVSERGLVVREVRLAPDLGGVGLAQSLLALRMLFANVSGSDDRKRGSSNGSRWSPN